jgi:hypothetical protein
MRQFFQIVYAAISSANQSVGTVPIVVNCAFNRLPPVQPAYPAAP